MSTILDFQIQLLSTEAYSLTICERHFTQPSQQLVAATFSHRVDFLTDFSVGRLNTSTKDPAGRFDELRKIGVELYQKLFSPAIEQVWQEYKQQSEFLILCLRFSETANKLEILPWETLHDGTEFVAAGAMTTITRLPLDLAPLSALPPIPLPLKLFGFFASPLDLRDHERLNVEREQEILLEAINNPAGQGRMSADFEDEAKLEILERSLLDGYHILHFTGHGISPREGGGLLLEDAHGNRLPASIAELAQAVESGVGSLRLAVISGCQTARTLHTGTFSDLARELLRQCVPAVIAMQFSITDEGGLIFAEVLYKEIVKGVELERAVDAARRTMLKDERFFINNDALAIVLLTGNGACLQTAAGKGESPKAEPGATYLGDRLDPLARGFYGRRREYRKIRDAVLHQGRSAVIIHGIGGIGKTALLTYAVNRLRPRFKDVMSFDCRRAALAPETFLLELHRYFAMQGMPQLQTLIGRNVPPEKLAQEIARKLTHWPLLIVFDNFETQLDERRAIASEHLRVFLMTLVRTTETGSRFLFTTRHLFDLDGGQPVQLPLSDLSRPEALMLMQKLPNLAQAAYRDKLAALEKFGGHPYALVMLDRHCSHQPIDKALQDASSLKSELREFLAIELNYQGLSGRARDLLNRLAAFRVPLPFEAAEWVMGEKISYEAEFLEEHREEMLEELEVIGEAPLLQMLESKLPERREAKHVDRVVEELVRYGLLTPIRGDRRSNWFSVHSLVRDFCLDQQKGEIWQGRLLDAVAYYASLIRWTKMTGEYDNHREAVQGDMESYELLMEAEEFSKAAELLADMHPILERWGQGQYLEHQCLRVLNKLPSSNTATIKSLLGDLLFARGEYDAALTRYQQSLASYEELGIKESIISLLNRISTLHIRCGEYEKALESCQHSLKIAEENNNRRAMASTLHNIGLIHQARGDYPTAFGQIQQSLHIEEELGERLRVAGTLGVIGTLYQDMGQYQDALDAYHLARITFEDFGDLSGLASTFHSIGNIYLILENYDEALAYYQRSVDITENLGNRPNLARVLYQIGLIHDILENHEEALKYFRQVLKISEELGDDALMASAASSVGNVNYARREYDAAIAQYQLAYNIFDELGNQAGAALTQGQIGKVLIEIGRYSEALDKLLHAFIATRQIESPDWMKFAASLITLRSQWGEKEFDAAWQHATSVDVPKWLVE